MIRPIFPKKRSAGLLAAAAIFSVFSTTAMAQVEQRSEVSIQGTALVTKDTNGDSLSQHTTKSGGFLLGYSYRFNSWAGVEGNYGYSQNTLNTAGSSIGRASVRSDFHELTGAFVARIPANLHGFKPYALAGAGALIFNPTNDARSGNPGIDRQTKAAFVYGGGVEFNVTSYFGFKAEYRGLVYKAPDFKLTTLNPDKITHLAQPSVGIYFRF